MAGHPKFRELTEDEIRLHDEKNADYAQGGDPLGNFKRVATILGQYKGLDLGDPAVVAAVYMMKQLDAALWMMSKGYEGSVENVDMRLRDVHVYGKLMRILREEWPVYVTSAEFDGGLPSFVRSDRPIVIRHLDTPHDCPCSADECNCSICESARRIDANFPIYHRVSENSISHDPNCPCHNQ